MDWNAFLESFKTFWTEWGWLIQWAIWLIGVPATLFGAYKLIRNLTGQQKKLTKARIGALPKAQPDTLNVLIFEFDDDDHKRTISRRIAETVRAEFGQHANVEPAPFFINLPQGKFDADRERAAWSLVQDALKRSGYNAAVWGRIASKVIFPLVQALDQSPPERATSGHDLLSGLSVPLDAIAAIGPLIAARISAEAAPAYEGGRYMADILSPVAERLQRLLNPPPPWMDADMKARAWDHLGATRYQIGEQTGRNDILLLAIAAYQEALKEWRHDRTPLQWATTQNNLGAALETLGLRESGTTRLEQAVAAYHEALKVRTRDRAPLDWAMTQSNLGNALQTLGDRESGTARLEQAIAAHHEALKERTRDRAPLQWATSQNNLGNALQTLGERESGTERLEQSVVAFHQALKEWTRDHVPLQWATTQNNLGNALLELGKRESRIARLEQAVAAYHEALNERTRDRVPLQWATTQNNLGNAFLALAQRENGTASLEQAVAAYEEALKEWTRDRVPLRWATTQNNLGGALEVIGNKTTGEVARTQHLAAESAYVLALEEFRRAGASHYVAVAEDNLDRVRGKLAPS